MKLHEDVNAFRALIEYIHNKTGYRTDVLENAKAVCASQLRPHRICRSFESSFIYTEGAYEKHSMDELPPS